MKKFGMQLVILLLSWLCAGLTLASKRTEYPDNQADEVLGYLASQPSLSRYQSNERNIPYNIASHARRYNEERFRELYNKLADYLEPSSEDRSAFDEPEEKRNGRNPLVKLSNRGSNRPISLFGSLLSHHLHSSAPKGSKSGSRFIGK